MVASSDWVAFEHESGSSSGFEVATSKAKSSTKKKSASSKRRSSKTETSSVASWMNKPITVDPAWSPVAPPEMQTATRESRKSRPPRQGRDERNTRATTTTNANNDDSSRHRRTSDTASLSGTNNTSGLRSPPSRGRTLARSQSANFEIQVPAPARKEKEGRRGRSRSRDVTARGPIEVAPAETRGRNSGQRGRSTSRTRVSSSTNERGRSASASRRSGGTPATVQNNNTRGRADSRPPPTSSNRRRRSRSDSRTPVSRARSSSRTRGPRPPPSTNRTRREMRKPSSASSVGPGLPRSQSSNIDVDQNIGRDISFGKTKPIRPTTPTATSSGKRSGLMEKLFGDQVTEEAKQGYLPRAEPSPTASISSLNTWQQPEQIHSRILLTATVYHNTATNLWIATINTNQKGVAKNPATASKYLKAFSFSSEREARESAISNAPPKMLSFEDNPNCFICKGKFAMFRRASHCRNCGVCVCNTCSTSWPSKMIPQTYNLKRESQVKICKSCNFLSTSFKKALMDGDFEEALGIYGSGNINLRTPFPQSSKKEEVMHPIHCAVAGGNLDIVRWLVDEHFCPIKVVRTASGNKAKRGGSADQPILTSKGRSVLSIALTSLHVDIIRYLVVDCGVSIYELKDLKGSLRALEAVLLALPDTRRSEMLRGDLDVARWDDASFDDDESYASSLGGDLTIADDGTIESKTQRTHDSCILCYDNPINCVMTPCGHQVCCLQCSGNLKACPVCNNKGEFIKIFRP